MKYFAVIRILAREKVFRRQSPITLVDIGRSFSV